MSVQALTWVLEEAPNVRAHLVAALLGLANHADRFGKGAHPSQLTLARYTRKSDRGVRNDLSQLEADGLIKRGDQRLVAHLPADERPVVWNLAMDRKPTSAPNDEGTGSPLPPGTVLPGGSTESEGPEVQRQLDRKPTSDKPSTKPRDEPKNSPTGSSARTRGTRLPEHFPIADEMRAYARRFATDTLGRPPAARFDAWLDRQHLDFVDYWHEKPGAAAVKRDWTRAWQRWMRKEIEESAEQPQRPVKGARASPDIREHNGLMLRERTIARIEDNARFQAMDAAEAQHAIEGTAP